MHRYVITHGRRPGGQGTETARMMASRQGERGRQRARWMCMARGSAERRFLCSTAQRQRVGVAGGLQCVRTVVVVCGVVGLAGTRCRPALGDKESPSSPYQYHACETRNKHKMHMQACKIAAAVARYAPCCRPATQKHRCLLVVVVRPHPFITRSPPWQPSSPRPPEQWHTLAARPL